MKKFSILSVAFLILITGCSSNKYYDLGFQIGSSARFVDAWIYAGERGFSLQVMCQNYFEEYKEDTNDKSLVLPTSEELNSLVEGCRAGFREATRP